MNEHISPSPEETNKNIREQVASQYSKWVYPEPIWDLNETKQSGKFERHAPRFLYHKYWPNKPYRENLDILIAGCGTNMAARYAFFHPRAKVVGIDISDSSLEHEQYLKKKHALDNLELFQCTIENVTSLGRQFDYIDCFGVLHHLAEPEAGLRALREVLRTDGVLIIMVYATYGREGVYMLQELFRLMNLGQTAEDLNIVKDTIHFLTKRGYMQFYLPTAHDLQFDAGIVDLLLHKQDRAFTVRECLEFVENEGMVFQGWVDNLMYYPDGIILPNHPLYQRVNTMEEKKIWQAMELYFGRIATHTFMVCRPERDVASYSIAIEEEEFFTYAPVLRGTIEEKKSLDGKKNITVLSRPDFPVIPLNTQQEAILRSVNGFHSVQQCLDTAGARKEFGRNFFRSLWRLAYVYFKKPK